MRRTGCLVRCALQSARLQCHSQVERRAVKGRSPRVIAASKALSAVLSRKWLLENPDTQLRRLTLSTGELIVVQDDLLHPILGGNKLRKLDGLLPEVKATGCTDLVTYIQRSEYANRPAMLKKHAEQIKGSTAADINLHILPEGASEPAALLGCIRLIHWLAQSHMLGPQPLSLVVDCGTGTTATGLALGIKLAGLPWTVCGVMLAGPAAYYTGQQTDLAASFTAKYLPDKEVPKGDLPISWVQRLRPRRFGKVFCEDVSACQQVAQQHGILVDPIYSLAAWEAATHLLQSSHGNCRTVMLHTGGALGLQGVAQCHPDWF